MRPLELKFLRDISNSPENYFLLNFREIQWKLELFNYVLSKLAQKCSTICSAELSTTKIFCLKITFTMILRNSVKSWLGNHPVFHLDIYAQLDSIQLFQFFVIWFSGTEPSHSASICVELYQYLK